MQPLRISAKNLGQLALKDCCERCFWLKARMGWRLPYQVFPGIFSTIDGFTKRVVHAYFDQMGHLPAWLGLDGKPLEIPPLNTFQLIEKGSGIQLTGVPDELVRLADGTLAVVDFKTAKHSPKQDELFSLYRVQLNGYALIAEGLGLGRVSALKLAYCEPQSAELSAAETMSHIKSNGFQMSFNATIVDVPLELMSVMALMKKARRIYVRRSPPPAHETCKECLRAAHMAALLTGTKIPYYKIMQRPAARRRVAA